MLRSSFASSASLALLASLAAVGCPLDERRMQLAPEENGAGQAGGVGDGGNGGSRGGSGGKGNTGGDDDAGDSGSSSGGNAGSTSGAGGMAAMAGSGAGSGGIAGSGGGGGFGGIAGMGATAACPDLDRNGEPDCEETLITNSAFNADANGWSTEPEVEQQWKSDDANEVSESGSIAVANEQYYPMSSGTGMVGSAQCLPVSPSTGYRAAAQAFIAPGQGEGVTAGIALNFYASTDCSGSPIMFTPMSTTFGTDAWLPLDTTRIESPEAARSVKFRLVAIKPFRLSRFQASFDNVLFREDDD